MAMDDKPSRNEDEYFARLDADLIKEKRARLDAERSKASRTQHYMKCPKDGADLKETDFQHVKVDVCSECGGMWFDAGEIDLMRQVDKNPVRRIFGDIFHGLPGR